MIQPILHECRIFYVRMSMSITWEHDLFPNRTYHLIWIGFSLSLSLSLVLFLFVCLFGFLKISVNCWPTENKNGGCDVNIDYELQDDNLELINVVIVIPLA